MSYHQQNLSHMAYPTCETYFVEPQDASTFAAPVQDSRDYTKIMKRQRQDSIADELSRLADDEYGEDIMKYMRRMEVKRPATP